MSQHIETAVGPVEGKALSSVHCPKCVMAAILVAVVLGGAALILANRGATGPEEQHADVLASTSDFESGNESTLLKTAAPGVTTPYFGYNGDEPLP